MVKRLRPVSYTHLDVYKRQNLAFEKAKKADWATLNAIIQTVFPNLATNVEMSEVVDLAWDINKLHMSESSGFPTARRDARMGSKRCV